MVSSPGRDAPSFALVDAVEQCDACDDCLFDPVYAVVDGDALNRLYAPRLDGRPASGDVHVTIETNVCEVTVGGSHEVVVEPTPVGRSSPTSSEAHPDPSEAD